MSTPVTFKNPFAGTPSPFQPLPADQQGKVYVDVPHRYFASIADLKAYTKKLKEMGANVILLLPHFLPSFSEYVVKDYERPCSLFGTWEVFADYMMYIQSLGMDRMIDIPFNHADWQADHLRREWYQNPDENGIEAGADDVDADGNRVRINWGAFLLDNGNPDLQRYWLDKVIFPHVEKYHVNAIRIDAAWGLDRDGLATLVGETKQRFPHVWFLAENLGMDKLINLAETGINAGAERFFNNFYWYSGGRGIPVDIHRFNKRSEGKPTCTIYGNHDVLTPAMKALGRVRVEFLGGMNDKALHRQLVDRDGLVSAKQLDASERDQVETLMRQDFFLGSLLSSDLMTGAGLERLLIERVDVLQSGPGHFAQGVDSGMSDFMGSMIRAKQSDTLFCSEGTLVPFGTWDPRKSGLKGYLKRVGDRILVAAVNTHPEKTVGCHLPGRRRQKRRVAALGKNGFTTGAGSDLPDKIKLEPWSMMALYHLD